MAGESGLIRDEMSQRIVEAAEKLAARHGGDVTVRMILRELGITNRVFYNRFHSAEEVLALVYRSAALKLRASIPARFDPEGDFFAQVSGIAADTLVLSYRSKFGFSQYVFQQDTVSEENFLWWREEIRKLIAFGMERGLLRQLDADAMSYALWCFIRGYNADALGRRLPEETALRGFRYSFGILLDGMRA